MAPNPPPMPTPAQIKVHQIKTRVAPLLDAGQFELAASLLESVLPLDRRDAFLHKMLGFAYSGLQRTDKAILHLRRAAELGMRDPETLVCLANVYRDVGDVRGAVRVLDKLLAVSPDEPRALNVKARILRSAGDNEAALSLVEQARCRGVWSPELSILRAEILRRFGREEDAITEASELVADPRCHENLRRDALFVLGHIYDDLGRYDEAFETFTRANAMLPDAEIIPIDEFRRVWSKQAVDAIPRVDQPDDRPLFVIGMPRSGTTLTEQILSAHPSIATIGESNAMTTIMHRALPPRFHGEAAVRGVAREYLERTDPGRFKGMKRVVDKMPENYYFLPLITRALPRSRIIHCTRDARDTCLSCYFQNFGPRLPWTRRIETCARHYVFYRQVMAHWAEVIEAEPLESNYEALTADPRPHVERLLEHVALPFDEACMAHHKQKSKVQTASVDQVRNPIYTSSRQRWKNYEKHLGPMLEILDGQ